MSLWETGSMTAPTASAGRASRERSSAAELPGLVPTPGRALGIYIHVPFCATRCGYCDFNTYTSAELGGASPEGWLAALRAELGLAAARLGAPNPNVAARAAPNPDVAARAAPNPDVAARAAPNPDVAARAAPNPVNTVFVGGGTPSLLGGAGLTAVLDAVREHFTLAPDAEVTTEA